HGRRKADSSAVELDVAHISFKRHAGYFIGLGEVAITQCAIVWIRIRSDRSFCIDSDLSACLSNLKLDFDRGGFAWLDCDAALCVFKSVALQGDLVSTGRKGFELKLALAIGRRFTSFACCFIPN